MEKEETAQEAEAPSAELVIPGIPPDLEAEEAEEPVKTHHQTDVPVVLVVVAKLLFIGK